jgi:DNA replication protein DnaC
MDTRRFIRGRLHLFRDLAMARADGSFRNLILTSQLPVTRWYEQIGDPTVADGIFDRLVDNAHRIEMRGDSMRKNRGGKNRSDE